MDKPTAARRMIQRRGFLAGAIALGGVAALGGRATGSPLLLGSASDLATAPTFPEGISAGVPRTDGATLWTRVLSDRDEQLALVVSRQENLSRPDIVTAVTAVVARDGSAHFEATGLAPGEQYFYQFRGRDTASPIGRFRTLRPADSTEPVRIGFFTCQSYPEGYYATHANLAAEDLDLVVCLGDYVYEMSFPGVRGADPNPYPQTLEQMRAKYLYYRGDANLRAMHAQHAFVPLWDDHEFRNNYDLEGWTAPVGSGDLSQLDPNVPNDYATKRAWAWQAWFEHMPVPRSDADRLRTHRSLRLGRTVELFTQDARQHRDDQGCNDMANGAVCADADAPGRSVLGAQQKAWLLDGLTSSQATWKVMANANMMMGMVVADDGARAYMDTWDGYGAERTEVLGTIANRVDNVVVVTGDDHDTFAGELWDTGFAPGTSSGGQVNSPGTQRAGVEFVVPSVTSPNTADLSTEAAAREEEQNRLAHNKHLKAIDMVQHGYGVLEAEPNLVTFSFRAVDKLNPRAKATTSSRFQVDDRTSELKPA